MNADDYYTFFDITTAGFKSWKFPLLGLIFVAIGFLLLILSKRGLVRNWPPKAAQLFSCFVIGFAFFWTTISFIGVFVDYRSSVTAMQAHEAKIVEGVVTEFQPMPPNGHAMESFTVSGVRFEYSDFVISAGFNNATSRGGPIRAGLLVRIWYWNGKILRLDIKRNA